MKRHLIFSWIILVQLSGSFLSSLSQIITAQCLLLKTKKSIFQKNNVSMMNTNRLLDLISILSSQISLVSMQVELLLLWRFTKVTTHALNMYSQLKTTIFSTNSCLKLTEILIIKLRSCNLIELKKFNSYKQKKMGNLSRCLGQIKKWCNKQK